MSEGKWEGGTPSKDGEKTLSFNKESARRLRRTADRVLNGAPLEPVSTRRDPFWILDSDLVTTPLAAQDYSNGNMEDLLASLCQSRTGAAFVGVAWEEGYRFEFDPQIFGAACYPEERVITVSPHLLREHQMLSLIGALHLAWYDRQKLLHNPLAFDPDEAVLYNRAQKANMLLSKIKISLEQKLSGDSALWDHLEPGSAGTMMGLVQMRVAEDFRSLNNGQALALAYNHYFESGLVKLHDERLIHTMLLDEGGYVFSGTEPEKHLSDEILIRMGALPFGTNHILMLMKERSPSDPEYWVVEDRSNANFLWFIKFERSFQVQEGRHDRRQEKAVVVEIAPHLEAAREKTAEDRRQERADIVLLPGRFGSSGDFPAFF